MNRNNSGISPRRKFLGTIATGAAAFGLSTFGASTRANAGIVSSLENKTDHPETRKNGLTR
ncbi:MAG: twin-arginine translocation signal domain-containing protein [Chitinophagaceae bacterium]|nr:twin-arginine translocation signal domain-containing protein [Chitinophagaceae bacterium]